jgi:hypothetical protein
MTVCGMLAGNPVSSIITRALLGLFGGFLLGSLAGWIGLHIVRENPGVVPDGPLPPSVEGDVSVVSGPPAQATEQPARQA